MQTSHSSVIRGARVYHGGRFAQADVRIDAGRIAAVGGDVDASGAETIDAGGLLLLPGVIDVQVHFREPGLTDKEDLGSGSRAAAVGGVTAYLEMPNTRPPAVDQAGIDDKLDRAARTSRVHYGFFVGATPHNIAELQTIKRVCGIKVFMGSSTGDLLVDDPADLERIFAQTRPDLVVAVHAEDEALIRANFARHRHRDDPAAHSDVRDAEAAWRASSLAVGLARKHGHRLHVLHLTTARETSLFEAGDALVTAECSPLHLLLDTSDYARLGSLARVNPALKTAGDRAGLWRALHEGRIACIATDHAPHLLAEKQRPAWQAPSGMPLVENSLALMLDAAARGLCTYEEVALWMCEAPAALYGIEGKGRIEAGYDADLVLVDPDLVREVRNEDQLTRAGWSPWHGCSLQGWPVRTFVRGRTVARDHRIVDDDVRGDALRFAWEQRPER